MKAKNKMPVEARALTEEEKLIKRGMELKEALEPFQALSKEFDKIKSQLREIYKKGLAEGRTVPMVAPGVMLTWKHVDKPEYSIKAHTEYHIGFVKLVPVP